ncbi:MAG: DUF4388 domain-containing protein [Herpetosiphonaceae bacterium]|nr:DUF4388 domain-containing protein [Herpetosiphonaceae bacterium]
MALEGDLSDFSLVDIIQLIDLGKKTGGVELHGARGRAQVGGWLYFRDGKIDSAVAGMLEGDEAAYTLFSCTAGPFCFRENLPLPPRNINVSNEIIIMEGIQRQDTWSCINERVTSDEMILKLVPNPPKASREINLVTDKWRVLTMINGKQTVTQIAQKSGLRQFRAYQIVAELIEAGLIEGHIDQLPPEPLYPVLERIAMGGLGDSARVLLNDANRRAGLRPNDPSLHPSQITRAVRIFEQATTLLLGPSRARLLADQLRAHVMQQPVYRG